MIEEIKLVNRNLEEDTTNETPFNGSSDITFDDSGNIVRCVDEEGLEQNLLKAVLTSTQLNGYGTDMFSLLGKKNIELIRGKLMYNVLTSLNFLKKIQSSYLQQFPTYNKKSIISNIFNIKSDKRTKTDLKVSIKIQSLDSQTKNLKKLEEVNFNIEN